MASHEVIDLTALTESSEGEDGSEVSDNDDDDDDNDDDNDDNEDSEDNEDTEDIPLNDTSRAQLRAAIFTVSESRLREVVAELVDSIPAFEHAMTREFVTLKRRTQEVVPRWESCVNCDEEFEVNAIRDEDECSFHPGELELDEKSFADWDEHCHGPMDTEENRTQYPENFLWSCCGEDGRSTGCVRGQHMMAQARKKRRI